MRVRWRVLVATLRSVHEGVHARRGRANRRKGEQEAKSRANTAGDPELHTLCMREKYVSDDDQLLLLLRERACGSVLGRS